MTSDRAFILQARIRGTHRSIDKEKPMRLKFRKGDETAIVRFDVDDWDYVVTHNGKDIQMHGSEAVFNWLIDNGFIDNATGECVVGEC